MNDEQKYKQALERARECMKDGGISQNTIDYLCNIFPELKESKDEMIRNQIISFLKEFEHDHYRSLDFSSWLAWLERQGEKPKGKSALEAIKEEKVDNANRVEPKFKTGDWICNGGGNPCKVNYIFCNYYEFRSIKGYEYNKPISDIDANYHLWSIEDAKDGDVLYSSKHNLLWIYKNKEECHVAVNLNYANSTSFGTDIAIPSDVFPATKEQRDIFFSKMKEAGYEWNEEKKELKKMI